MQWDKLQPKYLKIMGQGRRLGTDCTVCTDVPIIKSVVEEAAARFEAYADMDKTKAYESITFIRGVDTNTVNRIKDVLGDVYTENDEGYFIDTTQKDIVVRSASERGLFYGAQAVAVFLEGTGNIVPSLVAYEYPICSIRGVKCYIPSTQHIAFFKKFVDMMCRYKHNTLLLEIGGAMEYKRYPEINVEWVKFCDDIRSASRRAGKIQEATYSWRKDSMHVENADGGFVSQDIVRELVRYCKERYINVIPEVLSLSHADYIVRAFPEIGERSNDPYPDTYCPSHPKTYRILFDIMDEIIDVFEPNIVHIGHDEYYTYSKCPRCKGKDVVDLFAEDVNKIYSYLHARGLKTMLWSDKFINAYDSKGYPQGGAEKHADHAWSNVDIMCEPAAASYKSIDKVPRDLMMMHWYWGFENEYDQDYLSRNMPMLYGNFRGMQINHFKRRVKAGALGGLCSNWSTLSETIMAWNGVIYDTAYNGMIFWDPDYDTDLRDETLLTVANDLYNWSTMDAIHGEQTGNYIRVQHTTTREMPFEGISDGHFLNLDNYLLGNYIVTCDNGREAKIPLYYGMHIASITDCFVRETDTEQVADGGIVSSVTKLKGVTYHALPYEKDGGTWYDAILKVPDYTRGFTITDVRFEKTADDCEVMIGSIEVL